MVVRDEADRYLEQALESLVSFCDAVLVLDDGSTDGTKALCRTFPRVLAHSTGHSVWAREGEGIARNLLLRWTLRFRPTPSWVLNIDADELVADGEALRRFLTELEPPELPAAASLTMREVWDRNEERARSGPLPFFGDNETLPRPCDMPYMRRPGTWWVRVDGEWGPRECPVVWTPPGPVTAVERWKYGWTIPEAKLACGREPEIVRLLDAHPSGVDLLHLGWSDPGEREERARRYQRLDGGRYHASAHLRSILEPPTLAPYVKPAGTGGALGLEDTATAPRPLPPG